MRSLARSESSEKSSSSTARSHASLGGDAEVARLLQQVLPHGQVAVEVVSCGTTPIRLLISRRLRVASMPSTVSSPP